jgi:hypothetical protein
MKILLGLLVCSILLACGEEVVEKPQNLIPTNTMASILYDLAIIQAAKSTNPRILEENNIDPMPYLYEKYGVDSLQFVQSDMYYASKPLQYEALYKKVESRLESEKDAVETARKHKNDSTRKAMDARGRGGVRKTVSDSIP